MSEFIQVKIDMGRCVGIKKCGRCVAVCPVNIFDNKHGEPVSLEDQEDECTLCQLCLEECQPDAITITKLYE